MADPRTATLYIVATPIGNLADISQRAVTILHNVDVIAVEDTRQSVRLLRHYAITTPMISLHNYNEKARSNLLLNRLQHGESVALISDAGTPLISDPGYPLVSLAQKNSIPVMPVPGCCALIAALSASGLPSDCFYFKGFLPAKKVARQQLLQALKAEGGTLIFYESPRRLVKTLEDMVAILGGHRLACVAREMTKLHETIMTKPLAHLLAWVMSDVNQQRGECVVLVEGLAQPKNTDEADINNMISVLLKELPAKKAAAVTASLLKVSKNSAYKMALKLQQK